MSTPQEVACSFVPAFFERLAANPADLAEMYSQQSSFVVVDFAYGTTESSGAEVPKAVQQWAEIAQGLQLAVDTYAAAPLYSGVSVYVSFTASSESVRHFFQCVTALEACSSAAFGAESYFVRSQVVIRTGTIALEPPVEEAAPEPECEAELKVESAAEPVAAAEPAPAPAAEPEAKPSAAAAAPAKAAPAAPRASKPKTWASLASTAPARSEQRPAVKVVSQENGSKADAVEAAPARSQDAKEAPAKSHPKAPRAPLPPIGDRLMFNIDHEVSDEEIKQALGLHAAHIVSLRNNSASGRVFLDFGANEKVMDALKASPPVVGARKTRVSVYRQKSRE